MSLGIGGVLPSSIYLARARSHLLFIFTKVPLAIQSGYGSLSVFYPRRAVSRMMPQLLQPFHSWIVARESILCLHGKCSTVVISF
ncbi:hypothetical protein BJX99DRAFT_235017 [Aspergillus californicus]